jgi:YggT family protein
MAEYREKVVIREEVEGPRAFIARIVFYAVDLIEILLAVRFFLKALNVRQTSGFANFIYTLSAPIVKPFEGIFPPVNVAGLTLEWATILAMVVLVLLAMLIVRLLQTLRTN